MGDPQGDLAKGMIAHGKVFSDCNTSCRKATDSHTSARHNPHAKAAKCQQSQGQRTCGKHIKSLSFFILMDFMIARLAQKGYTLAVFFCQLQVAFSKKSLLLLLAPDLHDQPVRQKLCSQHLRTNGETADGNIPTLLHVADRTLDDLIGRIETVVVGNGVVGDRMVEKLNESGVGDTPYDDRTW
jgi:hypothetical protein